MPLSILPIPSDPHCVHKSIPYICDPIHPYLIKVTFIIPISVFFFIGLMNTLETFKTTHRKLINKDLIYEHMVWKKILMK